MTKLPKQIGPYSIEDVLGEGGMGVVYRARTAPDAPLIALKTLHVPSGRRLSSFQREIRALGRIRHPGIVKIIDEGTENGVPWYAMELVEGITLGRFNSEYVWNTDSFAPAWTAVSQTPVPGLSSPETDSHWWTKILGTTMDVEFTEAMLHEPDDTKLAVPRRQPADRFPAAGGNVPNILKLIQRLCHALAYLHGVGIVHRDLKPSNILVRADGDPVIMDFGLMLEFWDRTGSREALDVSALAGGTLPYIAPEQIIGQHVDARADLYSLGCILYELLTGHVPFVAQTVTQAIHAHLKLDPIPPRELVNDMPEPLNELVMNLLEKNPAQRPGHADTVAHMITTMMDPGELPADLPPVKPYLYRAGLCGRETEMGVITRGFKTLKRQTGGVMLAGGESGIGKTRLLIEVGHLASLRKMQHFFGRCLPPDLLDTGPGAQIPLKPFRMIFEQIHGHLKNASKQVLDIVIGSRGKVIVPFCPLFGGLPGQEDYPDPEDLPPEAARFRLFNYIGEILRNLSRRQPVLLLLDDIQYADEVTRNLILFLLKSGSFHLNPLLLLATYREEQITPFIQRLKSGAAVEHIPLSRLKPADIRKIVCDMLADRNPPGSFVTFLQNLSDGNPYFTAEYLRDMLENRELSRSDRGKWIYPDPGKLPAVPADTGTEDLQKSVLPHSLKELVLRQKSMLSGAAAGLVNLLAVMGFEFEVNLIWHIAPFTEDNLDALDELLRRQILHETSPGRYAFVHRLFREVIYRDLSAEVRREHHITVARGYQHFLGADPGEHHAAMAAHWDKGGAPDTAAEHYLAAARRAVEEYAQDQAELLYQQYFRCHPDVDRERIKARNEYAHSVLVFTGRTREGLEEHQAALAEAREIGAVAQEIQSLSGLLYVEGQIGQFEDAEKHCRESLRLCRESGDRTREATALTNLGSIYFNTGRLPMAESMYQDAMEIHTTESNLSGEAFTLINLGSIQLSLNQFDEALKLYNRALRRHREIGEKKNASDALKNMAIVYWTRGELAQALKCATESLAISREIGDRTGESTSLANTALILHDMRDLESSAEMYRQALQIQRETNRRMAEGVTLSNYAYILYEQGDVDAAESMFNESNQILVELGAAQYESRHLHSMAMLKRQARGDYPAAERFLDRAEKILKEQKDEIGYAECLCERGHLAIIQGKSAAEYLQKARAVALEYKLTEDSELVKTVDILENAEQRFQEGGSLFRGQCPEDFPPDLFKVISGITP